MLQSRIQDTGSEEAFMVATNHIGTEALIGYSLSKGHQGAKKAKQDTGFEGHGWTALVMQDSIKAFAQVNRLRTTMLYVGIFVIGGIFLVVIAVTRRVNHSIGGLTKIANQVARGNFDGSVTYKSDDEIGHLVNTFNGMITDLKSQRAQLVDKDYVNSIVRSMNDMLFVVDGNGAVKNG